MRFSPRTTMTSALRIPRIAEKVKLRARLFPRKPRIPPRIANQRIRPV